MAIYKHSYPQRKAAINKQWSAIITDVAQLLLALPENSEGAGGAFKNFTLMLADGTGKPDTLPIVSDVEIALNGVNGKVDLSYESLWLTKARNKEPDADYCKTARKPYDLVVCAILIVVQHHAPDVWDISTDGSLEDWDSARDWVEQVLGYEGAFDEVMAICEKKPAAVAA